jgi:hypothetical protein
MEHHPKASKITCLEAWICALVNCRIIHAGSHMISHETNN